MTFQRPNRVGTALIKTDAPDTANLLAATLDEWQKVRNQPLPPPLPVGSMEAALWWMKKQEPEQIGETRRIPRGDSTYWHLGYFVRVRQSLLNFLRMTKPQRETVLAAIEDGVPYRGDDWQMFLRIMQETERAQEEGIDSYRADALRRMRELRLGLAA